MYFIAASPSHAPFEDDFPIAKVDILSSIDWGWMMSTSASTSQSLTSDQKNAKKQKPSGSCGFVFRDPGWLVSSNTCLSWISTRTPFAEVPYYSYFWGRNLHLPVHVQRFQQESSYNRATKGKKTIDLFGLGDRHINSKSLVGISPCSFRACKKIQNTILYIPENKPEPQEERILSNLETVEVGRLWSPAPGVVGRPKELDRLDDQCFLERRTGMESADVWKRCSYRFIVYILILLFVFWIVWSIFLEIERYISDMTKKSR